MKNTFIALSLLVSLIFAGTEKCDAKLYVQILNNTRYDAAKASLLPSKQGWGKILSIISDNTLPKRHQKKNVITREASININEGSDLIYLHIIPKGSNDLAVNKLIKVNKFIISKEIANYNLGVNAEIEIHDQVAKVDEDSIEGVKMSLKFSHPDKK